MPPLRLEVEPDLLNGRVEAAEAAIRGRLEDLRYDAINTKSGTLWMTHSEAIVSTSLPLDASGHYGFLAFSG